MRINSLVKKMFALSCCVCLVGGMMTGCGKKEEKKNDPSPTTNVSETDKKEDPTKAPTEAEKKEDSTTELSGTITMVGSTSMEKLALAAAEDFMGKNEGVTVNAEFVGSGAGIEAVGNGSADIGNASRNLKDSEKESGIVENIVAIDGIAVVVNTKNTVSALSKEQLTGIYTGQIKNWSEVGGADSPIVVIGREASSGTRGAFEEILGVEDACAYANELDNTGAVMAQVAATEGAIGYISLDVVDDSVKAVDFEGAKASPENVKNGSYTLARPFVMATKGEIKEQSELVQAFFDYMSSDAGKEIVKKVGLVTVD